MGSATRHYANALDHTREALLEQGRADFDAMNARHTGQYGPYPIKDADWTLFEKDRETFAAINANFGRGNRKLGQYAVMCGYMGDA